MSPNLMVLYAEDDENDAYFMVRAFAQTGGAGRLRVAPNGQDAIDYLSGAGEYGEPGRFPLPDLILLDVKMPELSGLEALEWIRGRREFDGVAVVMFTSSTQESDVAFCREHGANGFFVKPANADNLGPLVVELQRACAALSADAPLLKVAGNQLQ